MDSDERQFLNSEEVSKIFGVPEQTIRDWAAAGRIEGQKIGSRWFFPKDKYIPDKKEYFCTWCQKPITSAADFRDNLSRKEFAISGLCQDCQDKTFKEEE